MNISSYNVTDVTYHYIGLRVLANVPANVSRNTQVQEISRSILKYVTDKALRLMLPQPGGTFEGTGEKVCQELVHFRFVRSSGGRYELTEDGHLILRLLASQDYKTLRQMMAQIHLRIYDNLRDIVQGHIDSGTVWRPLVEAGRMPEPDYLGKLLAPTFGEKTEEEAAAIALDLRGLSAGKIQDALQTRVIRKLIPKRRINLANFRAICNRLVSLRLLNERRMNWEGCEFIVSYSPCILEAPQRPWYVPMEVPLEDDDSFHFFFCEPDMSDQCQQDLLLSAVDKAFSTLSREGGYYDIPDLRDWVCQELLIPETVFDEGIKCLLDRNPPVLAAGGIQYDRITARRRPLVRGRRNVELHNLIRRA